MDNKNKIFDLIENTDFSNIEKENNQSNEQSTSSQNKNATFFEKFEKTKKDMLKEKKANEEKAEKSLRLKNKVLGFDHKLRDDDFIRNLWIACIVFGVLFVIYASVALAFLGPNFNNMVSAKWVFTQYYGDMNKTIVVFSSILIIIIPLPYLYLLGTWFVGINGSHKSKPFFIVNVCVMLFSVLLMLLIIPMSSIIFDKTIWFKELGNGALPDAGGGEGGGESGDGSGDSATRLITATKYLIGYITTL